MASFVCGDSLGMHSSCKNRVKDRFVIGFKINGKHIRHEAYARGVSNFHVACHAKHGNEEVRPALWGKSEINSTRKYMHAETLALLTKPLYFPNMKYLK